MYCVVCTGVGNGSNLPAVIDRRTAAIQKMQKSAIGEGSGPVIELSGKNLTDTSPINIPSTASVKFQNKTGYQQVQYKWSDGTYSYKARWHTRTPGAPINQGNTWVIERKIPGQGATLPVNEVMTGQNTWTRYKDWFDAITARKNGTATTLQDQLLESRHWSEK